MGFWKKMTEATITITRFRQLPIECVTGDTRCRIMYDTCDTSAAFRTLQLQCTFVQKHCVSKFSATTKQAWRSGKL